MIRRLSASRLGGAMRLALRPSAIATRGLHASAPRYSDVEKTTSPTGMALNFALPSGTLYEDAPVEMVIVPSTDGMFGIMPNHVPTIAELKPGVVSVQEAAGGPLKKYFVSGGFATMTPESVLMLSVLEAVEIEDLDAEPVKV